uniref:Uncharacterized protein n=1 Tax=Trichobilharzia regenti TaxID=157069 RepID=A0AA85ITK7_TRIRE|nr:unnamed protein product [Trichobilharzia regenti]
MRTGLLNKNYSTSRIDQNTEPPQNPLNLLHETCERLLNECAQRNRKSLKFRFIDLNCNLQTANVSHNHYNEMNSTPTCHSNINNNNKYGIYNQKLFQYNANIQSDEEILDYSMNPMKRSSFSPSSSSSPPSLPSTSSNSNSPNNSNLSTDASISAPSNILFNNSMSNFPYSCFASYALKMNNNNNNSNNLPMHSMNDLIQNLLFQQKLNDPICFIYFNSIYQISHLMDYLIDKIFRQNRMLPLFQIIIMNILSY